MKKSNSASTYSTGKVSSHTGKHSPHLIMVWPLYVYLVDAHTAGIEIKGLKDFTDVDKSFLLVVNAEIISENHTCILPLLQQVVTIYNTDHILYTTAILYTA